MIRKNNIQFIFSILTIFLLINLSFSPNLNGNGTSRNNEAILDIQFIYNMTQNLSNIIFDLYDEENGEIAKGRFFGTKGEHYAAKIIAENMTKFGLNTTFERIENLPDLPTLAQKLEVLNYKVSYNNKSIECFPAASWLGLGNNPSLLNCTFNYSNLKVKHRPRFPSFYNPELARETDDFIFIDEDQWFNDDENIIEMPILNPLNYRPLLYISLQVQTRMWRMLYPRCKGLILYDFNSETHDQVLLKDINVLPVLFINGKDGRNIVDNIENARINYHLQQRYNTSVESYNVIGQINGTDTTKNVIVDSLYDSWWCQGTADSAIGMSIVLAIAKYFNETNLKPKYNLKFIAFGGEEYGLANGAQHYEATHRYEDIVYVIDLNQLGFYQKEPQLSFHIFTNKLSFLSEIWQIVKNSNYVERTNNTAGISIHLMPNGAPSDDGPFAKNRPDCKTVSFIKDRSWILHHRDGQNHTEGDVLKYFDWEDVTVTSEMILNVTKHLVLDDNNQLL
jgi:hypothetical protein